MKRLFVLLVCLITVYGGIAQNVTGIENKDLDAFINAYDIRGHLLTNVNATDFDGSPMFKDDWSSGIVKFKNGRTLKSIDIQFDLVNQQLRFKSNEQVYLFVDPVVSFQFPFAGKQDSFIVFKNGYPGVLKYTDATFYEVLSEGKHLQLLKYRYKTLEDNYVYNGPARKRYKEWIRWFVHDVRKNRLIPINNSKNALVKQFPHSSSTINEFDAKRLSDTEMIRLIKALDDSE